MENELKPPFSQFPHAGDFPVLSPVPNSPQHTDNKKISAIYIITYGHIQGLTKIPVALLIQLSFSLQSHNFHTHP